MSILFRVFWIGCAGVSLAVTIIVGKAALEKQAAPPPPGPLFAMGQVVQVGDLDLTIVSMAPFNGSRYSFSQANVSVRFRATNARGPRDKPYELTHTSMKLIDDGGYPRDVTPCVQCPGVTGDSISIKLRTGETIEGSFYYRLPPNTRPVEVFYRSLLAKETARIDVSGTLQGALPQPSISGAR